MAAESDVIVRLRAIGQAAFKGAMDSAAKSITGVDKAADKADDSTGRLNRSSKGLRGTVGTMAKWAGGAAAVAGAVRGLKAAGTATMDLAKTTMALQRQTGMSAETASAWGSVLKARGVDSKQFGVGMTALSKRMVKASSDTKAYAATFGKLGVAQDTLKAGDINSVLMQSADAFAAMTNPAEKAALAQQLFGKQAQNLIPLMASGSAGIQEQLGWAEKYGATLSGDATQGGKDLVAQQREMMIASEGLKVQLGTALMPSLLSVAGAFLKVVQFMQPMLRNGPLMATLVGTLTAAFIALKVAEIAATISTLGLQASFLLIPLAIVAVIAALVIAYKKVGWFRDGVNAAFRAVKSAAMAAFNWIKKNWPLLLAILGGPFTAATYLIVRNWDKIKGAARSALENIKRLWKGLPDFFLGIGKDVVRFLVNGIKAAPGAVLGAIKGLLPGKLAAKVGDKLGLWAAGGLVPSTQWGIVGEAGPELLQLPGGSRITPLPKAAPTTGASIAPGGGAAGGNQTTAHFYLDRRLIATAVAQDTADQKARR